MVQLRDVQAEVDQEQRVYELTEVVPVEGVAGAMRLATGADEDIVTA